MPAGCSHHRADTQKIAIFRRCFHGRLDAYGTYDPRTGRAWQEKASVTDRVILDHLAGRWPYGVYLLVGDRTGAVVADFDHQDIQPPLQLIEKAAGLGLAAYVARSRRKGFHVYMFARDGDMSAAKSRRVMRWLVSDVGAPNTEIFPKQDRLTEGQWGNYLNAPLFAPLVSQGRGVFLDPQHSLEPFPDQWELLDNVMRVSESGLDAVLGTLGQPLLSSQIPCSRAGTAGLASAGVAKHGYGLPPCAQRMLEGVPNGQRVSCFRLAGHLERVPIPLELALVMLRAWAPKNCPEDGRVIQPWEIEAQARAAYRGRYRGCGCEDPLIARYCDPTCPIKRAQKRIPSGHISGAASATEEPQGAP